MATKNATHDDAAPSAELDKLKKDLDNVRADVGHLLSALKGYGREKAGSARSSIEAEFSEIADELRRRGREAHATVEKEVTEKPLTALAIAFGVGFVLGKILDRS